MSVFRVEKNKNYTVISNHHLRDRRLSLRTIGLLSMILSLPENWDYSQAGLAAICKDGEDSVRRGLKELEEYGYLKRERERDEKGRVTGIVYHVYEVPAQEPKNEKQNMGQPKQENPLVDNQNFNDRSMDLHNEGKQQQINKESLSNKIKNKEQSNNPSAGLDRALIERQVKSNVGYGFFEFKNNLLNQQLTDGMIDIDEYDYFMMTYNLKTINQVIAYMLDILTSLNNDPIQIGQDLIDREVVKNKLMLADLSVMKQVVYALNTTNIKNPKKYAISMIYNS